MTLHTWAAKWGVSLEAVADLQRQFGMEGTPVGGLTASGETAVSAIVRLEAAQKGCLIWRNNRGAMQDATGRWVRFGLANDSKNMDERIKSADLIGVRPVTITPAHVGTTIGQFLSREVKAAGWHYTATPREVSQLRWAELIASVGGDAAFTTGEGSI